MWQIAGTTTKKNDRFFIRAGDRFFADLYRFIANDRFFIRPDDRFFAKLVQVYFFQSKSKTCRHTDLDITNDDRITKAI